MKLLDVITAPWAIEPAKLLEIQAIYATHLRGEKIDIAAVEQKLGRPLANEPKSYTVDQGVAILPIEGVIAKRANLFSQISGGVSSELAGRALQAAMADPAVHSIILAVDSPGGTVDGTQALADLVSASTKPIVTLASGTIASAAYWIGSAANAVYITEPTTMVGSIGVVAAHKDISQAEKSQGIKTTEVVAGQYKRVASNYGPLTKEGLQSMQDQVDYTYAIFVNAVAANRGVSVDTVLKDMADGRTFIGQQAIDAGLVDGVSTLAALVQQLNQNRSSGSKAARASAPDPSRAGVAQPVIPQSKGAKMLTAEQIASENPDAAAALRAEGAAAERERIAAVEGQLIPGHEALIHSLKFDGKSTAGDAAMAVLAADRGARAVKAKALADEAPKPLAVAPVAAVPAASDAPLTRAELDAKAKAYMAANKGVDYVAAVKAVESEHAKALAAQK